MKVYKVKLAGRTNQTWTDVEADSPVDAAETFVMNEGYEKPALIGVDIKECGSYRVEIRVVYDAKKQ